MKRLLLATALAAFVTSGCAKNKSADETDFMAEDSESADTATVSDDVAPEDQQYAAEDAGALPAEAVPEAPPEAPAPADGSWAQAETVPAAAYGTGQVEEYTVRQGDTLMKVAFNIYGDIGAWKQLYEMNRDTLRSTNALRVGQVIKYDKPVSPVTISQNGEPFLIRKGDTLGTISNEVYATPRKWRKLWENNRELVKDPNRIYAGFYLYYQITEEEKRLAEQRRGDAGAPSAAQAAVSAPVLDAAPAAVGTTATNTATDAVPAVDPASNRDPAATQ